MPVDSSHDSGGSSVVPFHRAGSQDKAIETNLKGLKAARERKATLRDVLIPSWGEPELVIKQGA